MKEHFDRLREFARAQNLELVDRFERIRADALAGRTAAASEALAQWRALLDRHVSWEEQEVNSAYRRRCRIEDLHGLGLLVDEHRAMGQLAGELADLISITGESLPDVTSIRELVDEIDVSLMEHRLREENEVCFALDHALDAPTIEQIEDACPDL